MVYLLNKKIYSTYNLIKERVKVKNELEKCDQLFVLQFNHLAFNDFDISLKVEIRK